MFIYFAQNSRHTLWQCMLENFKHLLNCSLTAVQAALSVVHFGACLTANNVNDRVVNTRD